MKPPLKAAIPRYGSVLVVLATAALLPCLTIADEGAGLPEGSDGGISADEYLHIFPPAPVFVRAEVIDAGVIVFWERPPKPDPKARPGYDPEIETYRVYILSGAFDRTLIGETAGTWFLDRTVSSGASRRYAVTAVQRSGQESDLSGEARLHLP